MQNKKLGWLIAIAGVVIIVISLGADALGIGAMPGVIGWKQWLGTALGASFVLVATWSMKRTPPPD